MLPNSRGADPVVKQSSHQGCVNLLPTQRMSVRRCLHNVTHGLMPLGELDWCVGFAILVCPNYFICYAVW
jgi:hypothetical protein